MEKRESTWAARPLQTLFNVGTIGDLTDVQLLSRFATGHRERLRRLSPSWSSDMGPWCCGFVRSVLGTSHDVDDAFQATFLVLVRRRTRFGCESRLAPGCMPWHCVSQSRPSRQPRDAASVELPAVVLAHVSCEEGTSLEQASVLHEEVGRLPVKYRTPVVLCFLEGLTHEQAHRLWVRPWVQFGVDCRGRERPASYPAGPTRSCAFAGALAAIVSGKEASAAALSESLIRSVVSLLSERSVGGGAPCGSSLAGWAPDEDDDHGQVGETFAVCVFLGFVAIGLAATRTFSVLF